MFESEPGAGVSRWPLVRIIVGGRTSVVLLSSKFLPVSVHWNGRSVICPRENCALCDQLPLRGLFYAACSLDGRTCILELGALSSSHLEQHFKLLHGGMRAGLVVQLSRRGKKSPVFGEVVEERDGCKEVPLLDLCARVMALYHLPGPNPGEDLVAYERRLMHIAAVRSRVVCDRIKPLIV